MNKNHLWIALILSLLVVAPFNWFLHSTSLFIVIVGMIIKFSLYFLGILLALRLIQYLKDKLSYEKQIIELLKEIKEVQNKQNQ
ncbi:hypothetical protein [Bacillus cereus group sp. N21]|uniref:hypothetical protein n=1 Tax=Bacillus cereus group sp. N21 TaxID=2794591 RepID=UPI0018F640F0|nr:hypothetical protein [Bacillus cereus group sp. N21]MBJ8031063.1 hypothetical protein [Bacillus cereus group sp. N21]